MDKLRRSAPALRSLSDEALLTALDDALVCFEERHLSICVGALARDTGMSPGMLELGLRRTVAAHRRPHLDRWLAEARTEAGARDTPPSRVLLHVLSGNVAGLVIPAALEALLARCPVFLKAAAEDRETPRAFAASLEEAAPQVAPAMDWGYWKGGEDQAREGQAMAGADLLIVSGTGETVAAVSGRASVPTIAHGPKWSLGVLGKGWEAAPESWWRAVARECVLWEQRGCLSPVFLFVAGSPEAAAERLASALDDWDAAWPSTPAPELVSRRREFQTYFEMLPPSRGACFGRGSLAGWSREVLPFIPGGRCVGIHPLDTLASVLARYREHIQAVGEAFHPPRTAGYSAAVFPLESIQDPPAGWRADGRSLLAELLAGG